MNTRKYLKVTIILILVVLGAIVGISAHFPIVHSVDLSISHYVQGVQPNWFVSLSYIVSLAEFGVVLVVAPLFIYLLKKHRKREAFFILLAGLAWFIMRLLKATFAVPCPTITEVKLLYPFHGLENVIRPKIHSIGYLDPDVCYPSGHVFDYISIWGMIYYLKSKIWDNINLQKITGYLSILLISLVGIARISLGAHFFSDVIGGYIFGFAWLLVLISIYSKSFYKNP